MTKQRHDSHSTEFGLWLRNQGEIDSRLGYVASNLDYIWNNYKTGLWMLLEEKRYGKAPAFYQIALFKIIDAAAKRDPNYRGFHIIKFQKTSPEDGYIWLDEKRIDEKELIAFLRDFSL